MPHRNAALVLAACVAALPASAQAAGGPSKLLYEREFLVSVSGESRTDTEIPRVYSAADCSGRPWTETSAKEVWKFKSRAPTRMGMTLMGNGSASFLRSDVSNVAAGIPASGSVMRDNVVTHGVEPGSCGAGASPFGLPGIDCGTEKRGYEIGLQLSGRHLSITMATAFGFDDGSNSFVDCPVRRAYSVSDTALWSNASARVTAQQLANAKGTVVLRGSRKKTEQLVDAPGAKSTTSTTVNFRLKPLPRDRRRR